jgi:hypothetical protein
VAHRTGPVQRTPNRLIGRLPFCVGTKLSGGTQEMSGDPPDYCRPECWRGAEPLAAWHTEHVRCTPECLVIFSQRVREIPGSDQFGLADQANTGHVWCTSYYLVVPSLAQLLLFCAKLCLLLACLEKLSIT